MIKIQLNQICGFEEVRDYYFVARDGDTCWVEGKGGKVINGGIDTNGYRQICIMLNSGKVKFFLQHRIFMLAFTPNPKNLPVVNHIDENKQNNLLSNLEWETAEGNNRKARESGANDLSKRICASGEQHGRAKLSDSKIPLIFEMYKSGKTLREIGLHFGVGHVQIHRILSGKQRSQNLGV